MNDTEFKFEDLLEDLQIYILARLPRKLLSRCKCVSKHWNTTLTIQAFMFRHSRSYGKPSKLAFVTHYSETKGSVSVLSFELCDKYTTPNRKTLTVPKTTKIERDTEEIIIGQYKRFSEALFRRHAKSNICNDLICLFGYSSPNVGLLNLRTQDFIYIPPLTRQRVGSIRVWYALGFDPVNMVYKILSIYGGTKLCPTTAAIFKIGSKHWKPVEYKFLRCAATRNWDYWKRNNSFCLDGVIYWVNDNETLGGNVLTVVAFDLNHEVFTDYKLDTIPIKDVKKIRYYLTSLKGCPTLFVWKEESDEIQQLTLFNHKNPKATWNRRNFTSDDFPRNFPYGGANWWNFVGGGSILLQPVKPIKNSVKSREHDKSLLSWHRWYDLENFAIE
ncbi:putative F-box protein At2g02030 [Silene latifolia]|uniref:putative F-box protein At2g02030 n=1 Tax=Silene latifolia TaxID=37657 RepID=UPI003D789574